MQHEPVDVTTSLAGQGADGLGRKTFVHFIHYIAHGLVAFKPPTTHMYIILIYMTDYFLPFQTPLHTDITSAVKRNNQ